MYATTYLGISLNKRLRSGTTEKERHLGNIYSHLHDQIYSLEIYTPELPLGYYRMKSHFGVSVMKPFKCEMTAQSSSLKLFLCPKPPSLLDLKIHSYSSTPILPKSNFFQ